MLVSEKIFEKLNEASGVYFTGTLVERRQTPFQLLEVYDTPELGRMFRLDGANMTSERDEFFYHEPLVHPAATAHPRPQRALVIGGGDGGSSEELLKHSTLEVVHMAELDPAVIEVSKAQFAAVHRGAFANPRLKVTVGDGTRIPAHDRRALRPGPHGPHRSRRSLGPALHARDLRARARRHGPRRRARAAHRLAVLAPRTRS
jgi:spermidine synthase